MTNDIKEWIPYPEIKRNDVKNVYCQINGTAKEYVKLDVF